MASGSKKADFTPEQYKRQLKHSREWKRRNRERVRKYARDYRARQKRIASDDAGVSD